ncbi:MAG TPA: cytochrome c oxidase accessory protein CcoG [Thioalkalivibrio sp.]|nr:cytochrome c oxidase accessory protein CcoG [Thioalkalivibrio sp.]
MSQKTTNAPDEVQAEIYKKREKIYPREVHGMFARLRVAAVLALLGLYYVIPWLHWNGQQLVLFDLPARKFHIFGLTFWPQDFFFLAMLLVVAALALFLFTTLAGRLWCGYACPQTVWTEVFLWIERRIEGDRPRQMKLDKAPWSARKLAIKGGKHVVWILFSLWTGFTFVGYFTPIHELAVKLLHLQTGPWETFWILFYGFATYGNAGWMREQVCIYMCPYARFQSAMFDRNTLVISYDEGRGEPRGSRKRDEDYKAKGLGDCIDCTLCVQVCPTGIDIRDGLQYQCIGCAACVDVCDQVMDKMGYPKGLIRYTTENAMQGKGTRVLRPRIVIYSIILLIIAAGLVYGLATRVPMQLDVMRDRNALYRETATGLTENVYTLRLINMEDVAHRFVLTAEGLEGLRLVADQDVFEVPGGAVVTLPVRVQVDPVHLETASSEIRFTASALDKPELHRSQTARFLGPVTR